MRILKEEDKQAYTKFIESHERCNFQQSLEWGKVKSFWKNEIVLAEDKDGNIIGSISILIRKIPIFGYLMYSSRGPICDIHNIEVLTQLTQGIKELAKKYKAMVVKIEPDIKSDDNEYRKIVESIGYKVKDDAKDFREEIQPRYVFRLNIKDKTEDELFSEFHSKTRYNIRLARKKGVTVKEGTKEDLKEFHKIMIETGARDGFIIRPLEYFEKMYDELGKEHMKVLMAYYEGKAIAGVIPIMYGNKTWYLYGASSNQYRNVMPNYLLYYEMLKIALERKDDVFDLRGVPGIADNSNGLYRFKKGFGAEYTEFIGEVYIAFKPFRYKMYRISEKMFRKMRAIIKLAKKK